IPVRVCAFPTRTTRTSGGVRVVRVDLPRDDHHPSRARCVTGARGPGAPPTNAGATSPEAVVDEPPGSLRQYGPGPLARGPGPPRVRADPTAPVEARPRRGGAGPQISQGPEAADLGHLAVIDGPPRPAVEHELRDVVEEVHPMRPASPRGPRVRPALT